MAFITLTDKTPEEAFTQQSFARILRDMPKVALQSGVYASVPQEGRSPILFHVPATTIVAPDGVRVEFDLRNAYEVRGSGDVVEPEQLSIAIGMLDEEEPIIVHGGSWWKQCGDEIACGSMFSDGSCDTINAHLVDERAFSGEALQHLHTVQRMIDARHQQVDSFAATAILQRLRAAYAAQCRPEGGGDCADFVDAVGMILDGRVPQPVQPAYNAYAFTDTVIQQEGTETRYVPTVDRDLPFAVGQIPDASDEAERLERKHSHRDGALLFGVPSIALTTPGDIRHVLTWNEAHNLGRALQDVARVSLYG